MDVNKYVVDIKDYPKKGVVFKDITPLMRNGKAYKEVVDEITEYTKERAATIIVGPEARGFIVGCPVAINLELGFVPVRKPGKLPRDTESYEYDLEYGTDTLTVHREDIRPGDRVMIIDDILATGGTMEATIKLVEKLGGEVVGLAFILELEELNGRDRIKKLGNYDIKVV